MAVYQKRRFIDNTNHPCQPRRRFTTQDAARHACQVIAARSKEHRIPEACSKCNGWHLARGNGR